MAKLKSIDSGLASVVVVAAPAAGQTSGYCLGASVGGKTWSVKGPGASTWYNASTGCTGATATP